MKNDEKSKKLNQKFKSVFSQNVLSATWEKEGMEVSNKIINIFYIRIIITQDNFQKG